ncbi:MAG TPA: 23S rRNA (adenine(1618)-N(6))-methyltransferase RlmF [Opitutus sp.]|nr:23S rRNA (adenine(1618)-N(6))-methyltransferase RlmF [Opitutus sp.]
MPPRSLSPSGFKPGLHPRNPHRHGYDFALLVRASPELAPFVRPSPRGSPSIDFADPAAVTALNRALLQAHHGLREWSLPPGYLCPAVPGRVDYVHHVADLLAADRGGELPHGPGVRALDIGTGANCIYPIVGTHAYGWRFVATEVDPAALAAARAIVARHPHLARGVECRLQRTPAHIFRDVIAPGERFHVSFCNPPFHGSPAEAAAGTRRKRRNLGASSRSETVLNFGGQPAELWCPGGEVGFLRRMIAESTADPASCGWFTSLVSKAENLERLRPLLARAKAVEVRVIGMAQGQKQSRILAWTFLPPEARAIRA